MLKGIDQHYIKKITTVIYIKTGESRKHLPKPLILTYSKHITVKAEKRYSPPVNVSFR